MRNLINLLLIVFMANVTFAQSEVYLTDSIIWTRAIMGYGEVASTKDVYYYDDFDNTSISELYYNTHWHFDSIKWEKWERTNYTYINQTDLQLILEEEWSIDNEDWIFDYKTEYTYGTDIVIRTYSDWENNNWIPQVRWTNSWDPDQRKSTEFSEHWDNDLTVWESNNKRDSIFLPDGMVDTTTYFLWPNPNEMLCISIESFNYTYYPDTLVSSILYYDNKVSFRRRYLNTSLNANVDLIYQKPNDTGAYIPSSAKFYYLDENENIKRYLSQYWSSSSGTWISMTLEDYIYNENQQLVEILNYFNGDTSYLYHKTTFEYNTEGLVSKKVLDRNPENPYEYDIYEYYYSSSSLNIDEFNEPNLLLYPNPARESIHFSNQSSQYESFEIYSISGHKAMEGTINPYQSSIDISKMSEGTYIISLHGNNGFHTATFIKKK